MKRITSGAVVFSFILLLAAFAMAQTGAMKELNGGVLNGKAIKLPKPVYSEEAKAAGIEGSVVVKVLIDESGNVISAEVQNNESAPVNPLLADSARHAAFGAKFAPTMLNGVPVKVAGAIVYNFVADLRATIVGDRRIDAGVLNGNAISLPQPKFPAAAKAVRASGAVAVQVVINESGDVISATAVSGHPLLRAAAVTAARSAKFTPTFLSGEPVKVSGVIVYNFALPDDKSTQ